MRAFVDKDLQTLKNLVASYGVDSILMELYRSVGNRYHKRHPARRGLRESILAITGGTGRRNF